MEMEVPFADVIGCSERRETFGKVKRLVLWVREEGGEGVDSASGMLVYTLCIRRGITLRLHLYKRFI